MFLVDKYTFFVKFLHEVIFPYFPTLGIPLKVAEELNSLKLLVMAQGEEITCLQSTVQELKSQIVNLTVSSIQSLARAININFIVCN